eukprot:gnl/TRDRNA2_/TRDRNA2_185963_c0_seq1.p1 gnl/TRDRNA2_/TRDRNA2_185963_c0~~gnl/TRDRNA2_/TRDRNA2_185963_c0_seq1.p1  ORF type:complete len:518 (+),score=76.93 gnl/TRDRNA2_/TRDRNA2_185963_c0_seq1:55-1608(+)
MADDSKHPLKGEEGIQSGQDYGTVDADVDAGPVEISEIAEDFGVRYIHIWLILVQWMIGAAGGMVEASSRLALEDIKDEYDVSHALASWSASGLGIGCMIGSVVFGTLNDSIGRLKCIVVETLLIGVLCMVHLILPTGHSTAKYFLLVLLRIVIGIPYGGLASLSYLHILEFCPMHIRGFVCTIGSVGWSIGHIVTNGISAMVGSDWKILLTSPAFAFGGLLLALSITPESPRWLLVVGRKEEGKAVMNNIFRSPEIFTPPEPPRYKQAPAEIFVMEDKSQKDGSFMTRVNALLRPRLQLTVACCCAALFLCNACNWGYATWCPEILSRLTDGHIPYDILNCGEVAGLLGVFVCAAVLDWTGRRWMMIMSFGTFGFFMGLLSYCDDKYTLILIVNIVLNFASTPMWSAVQIYMAEALPTDVRATGCALAWLFARAAATSMPIFTGMVMDGSGLLQAGPTKSALYLNGLVSLGGILVAIAIPKETANMKMEDTCVTPPSSARCKVAEFIPTPRRREMV